LRARWALGIASVALVAVLFGFGPAIRSRVVSAAAARGLSLRIRQVAPGWFAVRLIDVEVGLEGVEGVSVALPEVRLDVSLFGKIQLVSTHGGAATLTGLREEVVNRVVAWRERRPVRSGEATTSSIPIVLDGLALAWEPSPPGADTVLARGISFSRNDEGIELGVGYVRASHQAIALEASSVVARLSRGSLKNARAGTVDIVWTRPKESASAATPIVDLSPPPPPILTKRRGAPAPPTPADPSSTPLLPLPDLHALRGEIAALARLVGTHLDDDSAVEIDGLAFHAERGTDRLSLARGHCVVARHAQRIDLDFSTNPASTGTPFSLRGHLPLDAEDVQLAFSGGPIALSFLGVKEGAAGLIDVDRATLTGKGDVVLAGGGEKLTFDATLGVRGLGLKDPRLATEVVRGLDLSASARGVLTDRGELHLDEADAALGSLRLRLAGGLTQGPDHTTGTFSFEVPRASCQALFESVPSSLLPDLRGAQMSGTLGGKGYLSFDSQKLDDLRLDYTIDDLCKLTMVPEALAKERFLKPFTHRVYLPDGTIAEEETGPGTERWTPIDAISPFMEVAVLTTEDGAFFKHHGFNHGAIRSSFIANLKARRFVRGASTISMQLAKNLFLARDKTVSRKLEELILTDYLEQNFTKAEIMELYLNIIEFGPSTYGIGKAAEHYFGRKPEELNLAESLFLSSILPKPIAYHKLYEKGEISDVWLKTLRSLMEISFKTGKITEPELTEGRTELVVFHKEDAPRPVPRPPVSGVHFTSDDEGWHQLN
jgi:hypothetical protein